jgi:hypothetical protein
VRGLGHGEAPWNHAAAWRLNQCFVVEAFAAFQPRSDGDSVKPAALGGRVLAFARPPIVAPGSEPVVTMAVIEWPDAASFLAWRFQPLYDDAMLQMRARAERGSVYLLPRGVFRAGELAQ